MRPLRGSGYAGLGYKGAMRSRLGLFAVASLAVIVAAPKAHAVGTRTFDLETLEQLSGGDIKGVAVGSDGVARAGWTLSNVPMPEGLSTSTAAAVLPDGSVVIAAGPGGKVVRVAGDQAILFADTKEAGVTALAVDRQGAVYAATTSDKIYKLSQGKTDVFATIADAESVLALAFDKAMTALYAATGGSGGSEGKVVRIEPGGASSVYFKSDDPFVVSLATADDGAVYAGTSGKGILYRIAGPGRATVLYDFPGEDVRAIAVGPNKTLYAIANEGGATERESEPSPRRGSAGGRVPPGPMPAPKAKPGKGSLWRFDAQGLPERLMHHDEFHYLSLSVDDRGAPYVGTGAEGRVYTVDDAHVVSLVADTDERQIGALVAGAAGGKLRFAVGSDPAVFHRVIAIGGADSVWTSKSLDAGLRARFGHIDWRSTGAVEVSTRTGDTQAPNAAWSAWSAPVTEGGAVPSPSARFIQVRARLKDAAATIAGVSLAFVTENLRAVVTEVAAHAKGSASGRESKEGIPSSGGEPPKHESALHVTWKVDNPDSDPLRYRVQFRREGRAQWIDAARSDEILTKAEYDWDTASLPEGKYRVRVEASDENSNPPADVTRHALESAPIDVDNTPPAIKTLAVQGRKLHAEVIDGLGPIARVEMAVDGRLEWRPLGASDGIFDTADERVDADLAPLLAPGPHIVAVRAFDAAGNSSVRDIEVP